MRRPSPRVAATSLVRLLAAGGVALLAACSAPTASSAPPTTAATARPSTVSPPSASARATRATADLSESFGGGTLPPGWETARATVVGPVPGANPAAYVHLVAVGAPAYVSPRPRVLESGHRGFEFRGRFRVQSRAAGETVGLATVENARRTENADLFVDARTGRCRIDLFRDDTALSPGPCDDGQWHTVTLTGDFGSTSPTLAWTLDGRPMPGIRSTGLAPSTVHRLWIGDATPGKTTTTDWTDLRLRLR